MNQEIYEGLLFARTLITDTKDFESRFEDILTMVIPPWIINAYGDIEETNVIIQEELTELSTNDELKVQFKNGYQQFWLQNNIPVTYHETKESQGVKKRNNRRPKRVKELKKEITGDQRDSRVKERNNMRPKKPKELKKEITVDQRDSKS
ncbi:unnamed protein product [Acanthoscelides obtectus]|uniref:Uncharacterized protein n=1 Tax=Acanthoscelides obtectus TaxID=200917 RepID=A0A9P0L0J1_ACAOB|nr:unnamed protein product [Acanthoscelides obtectus]CAK1620138.1 hypothetical protein AOBTE_LOCUS219 [Acanthoscelides obtectus]